MKTGIDKRVDVLSAATNDLEFYWTFINIYIITHRDDSH